MRRVGSVKERRVDVRLLAATNRDMADEVKAGRFREDLFYRINVMSLNLPPLRERLSDIPKLVQRFLGPDWRIEPAALAALERYSWPGNVRQLINAVERAKIMGNNGVVGLADLPVEVSAPAVNGSPLHVSVRSAGESLESIQRLHVVEVLARERGNKARAARKLGINRRSLYRLLEKYDIERTPQGEVAESG